MADVAEVTQTLQRGTVSDVTRVLGRREMKRWRNGDRTALSLALTNRSPADRLAICHLLLDRGADASFVLEFDNVGALHLLFSHEPHDYVGEKELAARLIDAGADVNLVSPRFGSPLASLAATFKFSDATLQPFYDVLIESGKLNLSTVDKGGRTMMENIAVKVRKRASLYQQLIDFAIASGQQEAIPPTEG
ncbi:MAG TPA: hypothetical protein H9815_08565 [Candidatus Ruania gallistercoris]|uniref:Ankyrin repeat domain-containing protein n=1 Tax=Candidatus Ruania gallistercoris TaxID=2838746 RepID=A0A9D2EDK6_9MICO|nr:hypothetical protein [Candidatus Ruania gallistercoris]